MDESYFIDILLEIHISWQVFQYIFGNEYLFANGFVSRDVDLHKDEFNLHKSKGYILNFKKFTNINTWARASQYIVLATMSM